MIQKIIYSKWARRHKIEISKVLSDLVCLDDLSVNQMIEWLTKKYPQVEALKQSEVLLDTKNYFDLLKKGIQFSVIGDENYPLSFYAMVDPPYVFSYLGHPVWLRLPCLSVVGSREPTGYSMEWMELELSQFIQTHAVVIVSGGARGVDQMAHRLALRNKRPTIAVIPSGLGEVYPAQFSDWIKPIIDSGGAVISEYDFCEKMQRYYFQERNRLISALGACTLIIEARLRSGTLITAHKAVEQSRVVLVLPGHPMQIQFQGNLKLLSEGATLVRDAEDLGVIVQSEIQSYFRNIPQIVINNTSAH